MRKAFNVYLWPGYGYALNAFTVEAVCEDHALDIVVANLINNNEDDYYMTDDEMREARDAGNVYELNENEVEGWMYWDATMEGAPYPVWLRIENMKISEAAA